MDYTILIEHLLTGRVVKATKYISHNKIVRATRRLFSGKILRGNVDIVVTIGHPNFVEREFIKKYRKTMGRFPTDHLVLKPYNPKKKAPKRK